MHLEDVRIYCLSKPFVTEAFPFDEDVLVFKVKNKIFLLSSLSKPEQFNVKCDPEFAVELREQYSGVTPGFHMNKKHWNTLLQDGSFKQKDLLAWIDHSYDCVVASLSKKDREEIKSAQ